MSISLVEKYKKDYVALYVDTINKTVKAEDTSRPFQCSSPSNGKKTIQDGWISKNVYDTHYGDGKYVILVLCCDMYFKCLQIQNKFNNILHIPNVKHIWFWYETAPVDASELRNRKQSKNSA